jgi:hypothetical protein
MKRAVRLIIPILFVASGTASAAVAESAEAAPAVAFGNRFVFGLQLFLLIFYALLLLVVPLLRGVCRGELPIELTARGARFPEPGVNATRASVSEEFRQRIEAVEQALRQVEGDLDQVATVTSSTLWKLENEMKLLKPRHRYPSIQLKSFFSGTS